MGAGEKGFPDHHDEIRPGKVKGENQVPAQVCAPQISTRFC